MSDRVEDELRDKIDAAIVQSSVEFQHCQMTAQKADLEGHDLAAAVLRSIAESHAGMIHAFHGILSAQVDDPAAPRTTTVDDLRAAVARSARHTERAQGIAALCDGLPRGTLQDDLRAVLRIGHSNAARLTALVAALGPETATGHP